MASNVETVGGTEAKKAKIEDKQFLLYFGSIFLWTEIERDSKSTSTVLSPSQSFKDAISHDIAKLREGQFLKGGKQVSWSVSGKFKNIPYTNIWLFRHSAHVNCSAVKFENFDDMCGVTIEEPGIYPRCSIEQHDDLMPFFEGNKGLKLYYTMELATLPVGERKQHIESQLNRVEKILDGSVGHENTPFCTPGDADVAPSQYNENAWSKRLAFSLKEFLPSDLKDKVQYTAEDGLLFGYKQVQKSGIPNNDYLLSCYIFQGASDITVKNKPVLVDDGHEHDRYDQSSGEECVIESGKQSDPIRVSMPPKIGEVLAAMHIILVQKVVKMFKHKPEKAKATNEVETHGMYVHKALGTYVCTLTIPVIEVGTRDSSMVAHVADFGLGSLTPAKLCFALSSMLNRENLHS